MEHSPVATVAAAFVIAGSTHVEALRRRLAHDPTITVFAEAESLDALRVIMERPPRLLALEAGLARTARGAMIVSRVKERHTVDIRVLNENDAHAPAILDEDMALMAASRPIEDSGGTRSAQRFAIRSNVHAVVDGARVKIVNLSMTGAQLVMHARVQPAQSLRLTLVDELVQKRLDARVAWSSAEIAQSTMKYRAGVSFVNPDTGALEDFCLRNAVFG